MYNLSLGGKNNIYNQRKFKVVNKLIGLFVIDNRYNKCLEMGEIFVVWNIQRNFIEKVKWRY